MVDVVIPEVGEMGMDVTFVDWLFEEGDLVKVGDPIFEVDTEKVRLPVEAAVEGVLVDLRAKPGDIVVPQQVVATIRVAGELDPTNSAPPEADNSSRPRGDALPPRPPGAPLAASPKARRLAATAGIELEHVSGTGPDGLITEPDVEGAIAAAKGSPPQEPE